MKSPGPHEMAPEPKAAVQRWPALDEATPISRSLLQPSCREAVS